MRQRSDNVASATGLTEATTTQIMESDDENLFLKIPERSETWEEVIPYNSTFTVELNVKFRGEEIKTTDQLGFKLDKLFGREVWFKDVNVSRPRAYFVFQVVLDSKNLLALVKHENFGKFEGDYTVELISYKFNKTGSGTVEEVEDTPLKRFEGFAAREGEEKELVITMRRGSNPSDAPAKGMQTFRILTELAEVTKILKHFNLIGKVTRVSKATPAIPTLAIALKLNLEDVIDTLNEEPMLVYNPSPQSRDTGSTELWAHLRLNKNQLTKRVTIEGIFGRASIEEIRHKLSYHGKIRGELTATTWTRDEDEEMVNVENGDLSLNMDIVYELNYLIMGRTAYRVNYQGQHIQCNYCYSWDHVARSCWRRDERRDDLLRSYYEKWKRQMNFQKMEDLSMMEPKNIDLKALAIDAATEAAEARKKAEEAAKEEATARAEEEWAEAEEQAAHEAAAEAAAKATEEGGTGGRASWARKIARAAVEASETRAKAAAKAATAKEVAKVAEEEAVATRERATKAAEEEAEAVNKEEGKAAAAAAEATTAGKEAGAMKAAEEEAAAKEAETAGDRAAAADKAKEGPTETAAEAADEEEAEARKEAQAAEEEAADRAADGEEDAAAAEEEVAAEQEEEPSEESKKATSSAAVDGAAATAKAAKEEEATVTKEAAKDSSIMNKTNTRTTTSMTAKKMQDVRQDIVKPRVLELDLVKARAKGTMERVADWKQKENKEEDKKKEESMKVNKTKEEKKEDKETMGAEKEGEDAKEEGDSKKRKGSTLEKIQKVTGSGRKKEEEGEARDKQKERAAVEGYIRGCQALTRRLTSKASGKEKAKMRKEIEENYTKTTGPMKEESNIKQCKEEYEKLMKKLGPKPMLKVEVTGRKEKEDGE